MSNILIIGATGNIGKEVIRFLFHHQVSHQIFAGVRDTAKARLQFKDFPKLHRVRFDFNDLNTFEPALKNIDRVFLLRPPHLSNVEKYFKPLIDILYKNGIDQVVFLSVQGVEKSKVIPHNKIEKLIINRGLNYVFFKTQLLYAKSDHNTSG